MAKFKQFLNESLNNNFWYHGSNKKLTELKPSQLLKLDYATESGVWLTDNKKQAMMYGHNISIWDTRKLKLLKSLKLNKQEFVVDRLIDLGYTKEEALEEMRKADTFKDAYDAVYFKYVDQKNFDGVILKGEFNKGYDLWIDNTSSLKKLKYVGEGI